MELPDEDDDDEEEEEDPELELELELDPELELGLRFSPLAGEVDELSEDEPAGEQQRSVW